MFERTRTRLAAWNAYRATVTRLSAQTDYILADMGITRDEIRAVARRIAARHGR